MRGQLTVFKQGVRTGEKLVLRTSDPINPGYFGSELERTSEANLDTQLSDISAVECRST